MINRIRNKLRSRTGASISVALFLFLVCAILSSVLLTAANPSWQKQLAYLRVRALVLNIITVNHCWKTSRR